MISSTGDPEKAAGRDELVFIHELPHKSYSPEEISISQVILKRFETPDETISFEKGRFEKITLGGMTIGRAVYEPGWKWSTHIGSKPGDLFYIPGGHDSWVVGDEPYVSLHFLGAEKYAH